MLKSKKNTEFLPMTTTSSTTIIASGTELTGDIRSSHDLRVDGQVNGDIYCQSKLVIGTSGRVEGNIHVEVADIAGSVLGNIYSKEALYLRKSSIVLGDIVANMLQMEAGGQLNGQCRMGTIESLLQDTDAVVLLTQSEKLNAVEAG